MEAAIAGRSAVTHDDAAAYTLTTVNGAADEARRAILNIGGALTAARNTVCPTQSKLYVIKNATTGGFATTLKTSAGTGIAIPNGFTTFLMCDGTNVVDAINYLSTLAVGDLTSGRVPYASTSGEVVDSANLTFSGSLLTAHTLTVSTGAFTAAGTAYIGETGNANVTLGLTINQGAADDTNLAMKSSDVGHGMTSAEETDTYMRVRKIVGASGGAQITGMMGGGVARALELAGYADGTDTAKLTSAVGAVLIDGRTRSGTTVGSLSADGNLLVVQDNGTTRFIFDVEGTFHADVGSTTFDEHDDLALLNAFDMEFQRRNGNPIKAEFNGWLTENRATLQRLGVVNYYNVDGPRAFVNFTKLTMLLVGAIRQSGARLAAIESAMQ